MSVATCDACRTPVRNPVDLSDWVTEVGVSVLCDGCRKSVDEVVTQLDDVVASAIRKLSRRRKQKFLRFFLGSR